MQSWYRELGEHSAGSKRKCAAGLESTLLLVTQNFSRNLISLAYVKGSNEYPYGSED
jgi:hypothetical protein